MGTRRDDDTLLALGGALLLHAGIVAVMFLGLLFKTTVEPLDVAGPVIDATLVNFTAPPLPAIAAQSKPQLVRPEPPRPAPPQPQPEPEPPPPEPVTPPPADDRVDQEKIRIAAEAIEKAEREQEEKRKQEQIELEREQDELTKMENERLKQLEDIRKQREAAEKTRKIEEQKLAMLKDRNHQADAEKQRDLENQRMEQLAAEEAQRAGTNGRDESLLGQYKLAITTLVDRNWLRPDTLREGFRCNVTLTQIIGGEVIAVDTSSCAGDPLVVRSLEAAVQREPLPYRGFESVFVRKVTIPFCYPREICIQ